jgi:hypothetical protein
MVSVDGGTFVDCCPSVPRMGAERFAVEKQEKRKSVAALC